MRSCPLSTCLILLIPAAVTTDVSVQVTLGKERADLAQTRERASSMRGDHGPVSRGADDGRYDSVRSSFAFSTFVFHLRVLFFDLLVCL